jgi:glutathione synthase/RimK-type ligase-like ATP-grasp enzyme
MKKAVIYSYNGAGASMRFLSQYLGDAPIINRHTLASIGDRVLINYGASYLDQRGWHRNWLNHPAKIANAINKLVAFNLFNQCGVAHPRWTRDRDEATRWLREGNPILARETATGSEGKGITPLINRQDSVPYVEFYSQFLGHDDEYRVHVVKSKVVSIGLKYKKMMNANSWIRNMDNGWAFHLGVDAPDSVCKIGQQAVDALGMDFGAADIGYIRRVDKPYVFEVNSAPTMSQGTARAYANAFLNYLERL